MEIPNLLSKAEAAQRARMSRVTLNRLIRSRQGPAVTRLSGVTLIREDALTAWIEARTIPPLKDPSA